ncbi:MAG: hypothetical protein SVR08_02620 [Spirochaetota bacterium]|nr:hypothetical protein [Spirochaetota bacterium]
MNISSVKYAGITSVLSQAKDLFEGLYRFFFTTTSAVITVTSFIGFNTLMLLAAVLFFSAGFSVIGVPKGKASFFTSLIFADIIWFIWAVSFDPDSYMFLIQMFNSNLVLLIPFLLLPVLKKVASYLNRKIFSRLLSLLRIPFINKRDADYEDVINISEKYNEASSHFQKSLLKDLLYNRGEKVVISSATINNIKHLKDVIVRFHDLLKSNELGDD